MRRIEYTPQARKELIQLWEYIANSNLSAADRLRDRIIVDVRKLAEMPGLGHARADVTKPDILFWKVHP